MEKIYNVSNTIENGSRMDRVKSRITPMKPFLTMLVLLMVALFGVNESAWGLEEYITVTDFDSSTSYSGDGFNAVTKGGVFSPTKVNHVNFYIDDVSWYNTLGTKRLDYADQSKNTTVNSTFRWTKDANYDLTVKGVSINLRAYNAIIGGTANANFTDGTTTGSTQNCATSSTGTGGTKTVSISASAINNPLTLVKTSPSKSRAFTITSVTFTYKVTHKSYQYGFDAVLGGVNNNTYGSATASGKDTVYNDFTTTTASKQVTYTATSSDATKYKFIGWYRDADYTDQESTANPYTPTLTNSTAGGFTTKTLYAKFEEKGMPRVYCDIQDEYEIGHEPIDLQTLWTREGNGAITYSIVPNSFVASGSYNTGATEPVMSEGRYVSLGQAGTLQLKMVIAADGDEFSARTVTKDITIKKYVPTFTWYCDDNTVYYNSVIENFCTSDQSTTSITRTNSEESVAALSGTTLTTYNIEGTTRVTMTQAENYWWAGHSEYRDITPVKAEIHVPFTMSDDNYSVLEDSRSSNNESNVSWKSAGYYKLGDGTVVGTLPSEYVIIKFEGIPDKLSFTINCEKNGLGALQYYPAKGDYEFLAYESATGNNDDWTELNWGFDNSSSFSSPIDVNVQLSTTTRYIKLYYHGSCWGHFENIQVSELQYFRRKGENATLNFATNLKNHAPEVQSFVVEHANAGYQTSVTAPDHYAVSLDNVNFASEVVYSTNATALTGGDIKNEFTVYVKYLANEEGTHNANVVVHNNLRSDINVPVTGTTQDKYTTTLHYIGKAAYPADTTNIAVTDLFEVRDANNNLVAGATITLGTGDPGKAVIVGTPNAVDPICSGLVNIAASYAGDGVTYAAATNTGISMPITFNAVADEVSIDTHGHSVLVVGDTLDLTGWGSALSNSAITFTSGNSSYFKVQDGKLIALAKGEANLTATSAGNCVYNSGSTYTSIKVRNANDPCSTLSLNKTGKITIKDGKSTTYNDITEGVYDKLEFKVWKQTLAASSNKTRVTLIGEADAELYSYEISADSLDNSENNAKTVVVNLANYQTLKKVQFTGNGSLYSQYFKDVKITQQAYLRANAGSGTLAANANVSMPKVKACEESSKDITISYSDISRIQLSHTNDAFTYEVYKGGNLIEDFDNDCGGYGEFTLRCKCTPTAKGNYSDVVTLSASGLSQTITLNGTANAPDRTIVWDIPTANTISATQSVDLTAYAETSCLSPAGGVYYTASPADAVFIDGNHIVFEKAAATVTVTAHTVPHDNYNDALAVDKVWTVGKVGTQMRTLPTITSTITYGDNASVVTYDSKSWKAEDVLNHNEVEGYINYVGPAEFTAAGLQNLIFNFTPKIVGTYDVCQFTVPVTVQQKASIATPVAANITYGQRVNESVLTSGDGSTTAGTWTWKDEAANTQVLAAREEPYTGLHVIFTPDNNNYTTLEATVSLKVDEAPTDVFTNASGDNNWDNPDNWSSGVVPADLEPDIVVEGDLIITEDRTVGKLTIENTGSVSVITGGTLTIKGASDPRTEYGDVHVLNDGAISLGNSADLQVRHFTIDAKLGGYVSENVREESASGQVDNPSKLNINGDAYFKLALDPEGAITYGWYDFVVPFEVNIVGGIFLPSNLATPLTNGYDFAVMSFDEAKRAVKGKEWNKYSGTMQPGRVYTITVDYRHGWNEIVFKKKEGASISGSTSFTPSYSSTLGENVDRGWNGFGNGTLFHTELKDVSASTLVHVYDHANKCYHSHEAKDYTIAVGTSFFMQVEGNTPIEFKAADNDNSGFMAPARNRSSVERFSLSLMNDADMVYDHLWVGANEDATEEYVIGEDVLKMGTMNESKIARMWTSKGGHDLCAVNATLSNEQAIIPLSLFAPQDAAYVLAVDAAPADVNLYLTYEGNVIWDLTMSPFEIELTKGTTNGYGLLMEAKAPAVTTGIEETENAGQTMRKVIINNTVYIITPEGKMYDIIGKGVKF